MQCLLYLESRSERGSRSISAMTEYHKPPKQVSNDWTPRLRLGKPQLFARCGWRQWAWQK